MTYDPAMIEADRRALHQMVAPVPARTSMESLEPTSSDERPCPLLQAWQALQETPSYVEQHLAANRGLIESIANQR